MRVLPKEDIVYFGDTARVPYGSKSRETIIRFSRENVRFLLHHRVKVVVVACNSATAHALEDLRRAFPVPLIGVIDPGVRRAVAVSRTGVGVIATSATIASGAYTRLIRAAAPGLRTIARPCPLFVPLVEEGWSRDEVTVRVAQRYLAPIRRAGVDALILGCTHYPLLRGVIRRVMGPSVRVVDSARETALDVRALLDRGGLSRTSGRGGRHRFFVSDAPGHFRRLARRFLGRTVEDVRRITS